jgi:hypothetical protein
MPVRLAFGFSQSYPVFQRTPRLRLRVSTTPGPVSFWLSAGGKSGVRGLQRRRNIIQLQGYRCLGTFGFGLAMTSSGNVTSMIVGWPHLSWQLSYPAGIPISATLRKGKGREETRF